MFQKLSYSKSKHILKKWDKAYRFGFNNMEKDNEAKGIGNSLDFGARIYDSRLGRWLSLDPLASKYPGHSPYNFALNTPIQANDPDGRDARVTIKDNTIRVSTVIKLYGSGATQAVANQMQSDIQTKWGTQKNGSNWTYTDKSSGQVYDVKFDISVELYNNEEKSAPFIIPGSWNPSNTDNFVEVGSSLNEVDRSFVELGDEGEWRGVGRQGVSLADDDPAPHEFGHLLGLKDRYKDNSGADKGWEKNIMGDSQNGEVDQRNIDGIVGDAVNEYNNSSEKKGGKEFNTKIDTAFPNK